MSTMKSVVSSQKLIDWWQAETDIHSRQAGVDLGQELFATGFLRHGECYQGVISVGSRSRREKLGIFFLV